MPGREDGGLARRRCRRAAYADNPADGRARLLTLTDRGRTTLRHIEASQRVWARELEEGLRRAAETLERLLDERAGG